MSATILLLLAPTAILAERRAHGEAADRRDESETGGRTALPIFREIMLRVYERRLVGPVPTFPREIEERIDRYLASSANPR